MGSVVVAHGLSCSAACGIFPDQGPNLCPLHWQADSQPLRHQGSPYSEFSDAQRCEGICQRSYRNCLVDSKSENTGLLFLAIKLPNKAGPSLQENQRLLQIGIPGSTPGFAIFHL